MNPERSEAPPGGGWKYTQKESGKAFNLVTWKQLVSEVTKHRRANGYDLADGWMERFEKDFCEQNRLEGSKWCPLPDAAGEPAQPKSMGLSDLRRFLNSVRKMIASHGEGIFVSQDEANRRAAICAACVNNANVGGCLGCSGVRALVSKIRGSRTTDQDSRLRQCTVCGCDNSVKVWIKTDLVDNQGLTYPPHCWIHTESGEPRTETEQGG